MAFLWLIIIVLAYLFFSLAYLGDKLVLAGAPKPVSYTFYVGLLSLFVLCLIPISNFYFPGFPLFYLMIFDAAIYICALYLMFVGLENFEVSKVMTTVGATQPILILGLTWIIWGEQIFTRTDIIAFVLLIIGTILISYKKNNFGVKNGFLKIVLLSSLLFSIDYILQKYIFIKLPFLVGFIWLRILMFFFASMFLLSEKNRREIFKKRNIENKKLGPIFLFSQVSGGLANFLQSYAIALAPVALLPIVNSLRGLQYVFLFLITVFLTVFFPKILKEEISKKIIIQKSISIILIVIGLALLVTN